MRYILINSFCANTIALERLLASLTQCHGFESASLIVVIGGCDAPSTEIDGNMTTMRVTYNALDFTALITFVESFDSGEFFYLHDTCVVDPEFLDKVHNLESRPQTIGHKKSCNMGLYTFESILSHESFLLRYKDTCSTVGLQKLKDMCVEDEDHMLDGCKIIGSGQSTLSENAIDFYGTGHLRQVDYFADMGIYKIRANIKNRPYVFDV